MIQCVQEKPREFGKLMVFFKVGMFSIVTALAEDVALFLTNKFPASGPGSDFLTARL